jgi:hypothetical protein
MADHFPDNPDPLPGLPKFFLPGPWVSASSSLKASSLPGRMGANHVRHYMSVSSFHLLSEKALPQPATGRIVVLRG